ncbi:MAG: S46 family peptidase [Cytophagaceae bacterium]|nr:S46 family peptidase [Cytophagaceae bacterium]MDW8456272.1 S46 family peptidase [Cytophagaceae bacterium]
MKHIYIHTLLYLIFLFNYTKAQQTASPFGRFDNGRMWTFDNPPIEYFKKTYGFTPSTEWLQSVQRASLRFANYCSASFVSADGLVMTNHHCARESGTAVSKPGENLTTNGFYAKRLSDERKVPDLYVDQLILTKDISPLILNVITPEPDDEKKIKLRDSVIAAIIKQHADSARWKGLELQVITFYKGAKFSLYGFKRYKDVRLVFMPEQQLGFFGGDPDNFTYPRYDLDCAFFRVYDDDGKPLKTSDYFPLNPDGAQENELVFVIGNPGRTDRLSTTEQLNYFRDVQLPLILNWLRTRSEALKRYNSVVNQENIRNQIFSLDNSDKAISGQLAGLKDITLMNRKKAFEEDFILKVKNNPTLRSKASIWTDIEACKKEMSSYAADQFVFSQRKYGSFQIRLARQLVEYAHLLSAGDTAKAQRLQKDILLATLSDSIQLELLYVDAHFKECSLSLPPQDEYCSLIKKLFPAGATQSEVLLNKTYLKELLNGDHKSIFNHNDPYIVLAKHCYNRAKTADDKMNELLKKEAMLNMQLAQLFYAVYGDTIPPDATFSLRIADGIVKGYKYNGTEAPYKTTYYGMYDRYYSNDKKYPWSLPKRWENPSPELLKAPINFVSTNDIIGGNSGSPMINKNKQAVGLIFDGNIESLPGRFIFVEDANRTVSVHAGGIIAALKHIYKADRLVKELIGRK